MMQSLTLYEFPPTLNEMNNLHYMKRAKTKEYWQDLVERACREHGIKPVYKAEITLELWFPDNRRRDLDNYSGYSFKFILDGLVHAGILKDDSVREVTRLQVVYGGVMKPSCINVILGEA